MKPVRLPASAVLALPRWALFALAMLYILPGVIGREPWKNDDAASFGIMWTMAHGTWQDWLWPNIAGLSVPASVLERPLVARVADLIPVALLSALVAVQVLAGDGALVVDARLFGLAVAVALLLLRAPFLVVVFGAALAAALLRLLT